MPPLRKIPILSPLRFPLSTALFFGLLILLGRSTETPQLLAEPTENHSHALPEAFVEISDRITIGAEPRTERHFSALRERGVQIVVSVDGARPEVEIARKLGLRYIHLSIGYDSVPNEVQAALRQLLNNNAEKIFIHCHHGHHRGPAAAAIAGRISGELDEKASLKVLDQCGTSKNYPGLWRSVRNFSSVNLDVSPAPLIEVAPVEPLAASMSEIDRIFDQLKSIPSTGTKIRESDHLEAATLLHELFVESARQAKTNPKKFPDLAQKLDRAALTTAKLAPALSTKSQSTYKNVIQKISADCRSCHRNFRN